MSLDILKKTESCLDIRRLRQTVPVWSALPLDSSHTLQNSVVSHMIFRFIQQEIWNIHRVTSDVREWISVCLGSKFGPFCRLCCSYSVNYWGSFRCTQLFCCGSTVKMIQCWICFRINWHSLTIWSKILLSFLILKSLYFI